MKKTPKRADIWYDLDNAAKIFPAISDDRNTNVFRIACELRDNIDKKILQEALDTAMRDFAYFQVVMRRGFFWYYLESTDQKPTVNFETKRPCARIFYKSRKELLFSVSYYRKRINLEVFHSVADGTGSLGLMRSIVYHYCILRYRDQLPADLSPLDKQFSPLHHVEDSFSYHYNPDQKQTLRTQRAYTIAGTMLPRGSIKIIRGDVPTKKMIALAKSHGVTVTAYLTSLLICAIYTELMPARARNKPIGVTVPVDLRNHFSSESARNFFSVVNATYTFDGSQADFDAVLSAVSAQLTEKLRPEVLAGRMNYTMGVQKNIFARAVPLALKNMVLRAAYHQSEHATTCALSNLGRITMPEEFSELIEGFSCLLNPTPIHRVKACICSFNDRFVINFTSCIAEAKVQRYFFRHLAQHGIDVCITSNGGDGDEIL